MSIIDFRNQYVPDRSIPYQRFWVPLPAHPTKENNPTLPWRPLAPSKCLKRVSVPDIPPCNNATTAPCFPSPICSFRYRGEKVLFSYLSRTFWQGAIWGEIQDLVQGFDVESPSTAMADVYRKERSALAEYTRELSPIDQQVGGVFVINGRFAGVETFGKPETFTKLFRKLAESYALEAINTGAEDFTASPVSHEKVLYFLGGLLGCDFESRPSVGLGIDVRLESIVTTGFALVHEGQFLHLSAFSSWKF